jgi:hypothetical protein
LGGSRKIKVVLRKEQAPEAQEIAALSFASSSSVIVDEYWQVWLSFFERLKLDYAAGKTSPTFVASHRARIMKTEFLTKLLTEKSIGVMCMYPTPAACRDDIVRFLEVLATSMWNWRLHSCVVNGQKGLVLSVGPETDVGQCRMTSAQAAQN